MNEYAPSTLRMVQESVPSAWLHVQPLRGMPVQPIVASSGTCQVPDLVGSNPSMGLPPSVVGVRSLRSSSVGVWSGKMNV